MKNFILYGKNVIMKPFNKKNINKRFLSFLNNPKVNKHLAFKKIKQTAKSAEQYLDEMKRNKNIYYAIFSKKKSVRIIGTATLKKKKTNSCFLGYMIGDPKFFGSVENKEAFKILINHAFHTLKFKKIKAGAKIANIASNFYLLKNNFKMIKKTKTDFFYMLSKSNYKKNIKYNFYETK